MRPSRALHRRPRRSPRVVAVVAACVLALAVGTGVVSAAPPAPTFTVTAPGQVLTGAPATIRATIASPAVPGERIALGQYEGSTWKQVAVATAASNSTVSFTVTKNAPATYYYVLQVAATSAHAAAVSQRITIVVTAPPTPTVSVSAPAQATTVSTASVTATVKPAQVGETAYLERLSGGTAVGLTSTKVAQNGTAAFAVRQTVAASYTYRVRVAATSNHLAGTSSWFTIKVVLPTPSISLTGPSQVAPGAEAAIKATVSQPAGSEIVSLEQATGSTWTTVSSATLAGDGTAALRVVQARAGSYVYRARLSATTQHYAGTSPTVTVKVGGTAAAAVARPVPAECGGSAPLRADGRPWVCTYADEFNGTSLDRRYWVPQVSATSGFYTGTEDSPACVVDDPATIGVAGGNLRLSAKVLDAPLGCGTARTRKVSGMVMHYGTFSQTYGKYEIRAQLPDWTGKGLQETFWLWPNDVFKYGRDHPSSGEIDLAEFYSNQSALDIPVTHYLFDPKTVNPSTGTNVHTAHNCRINPGTFNTYGLEWRPGQLKILLNGGVCLINNYVASNAPTSNPYAPFDSPFFLALTQLFGTTGNEFDLDRGPKLSTTLVDYVRIWA